jgi:hypothetical protein
MSYAGSKEERPKTRPDASLGKRDHIYFGRPCCVQRVCRGGYGGAGCNDIFNEKNSFSGDSVWLLHVKEVS